MDNANTTKYKHDILLRSQLTQNMSEQQRDKMAGVIQIRHLKDKEVLLEEGKRDGNLHVVVEGTLMVTKDNNSNEEVLAMLHADSIVGAMGFVDGLEHSASVHSLGQSTIFTIERNRLEALLVSNPDIVYHVMQTIIRTAHSIVKTMNNQHVQMTNYVSKINGRY